LRKRGEKIRQFILHNVEFHPRDITQIASRKFGVSRQAINKHIKLLVNQKSIAVKGATSNRTYLLHPYISRKFEYVIDGQIQEDVVWRNDILPLLDNLADNVETVWNYCFSEIFNNAIDHSNGSLIGVEMKKTAIATEIRIIDNGDGIFRKIQRELGLIDERHAVLELSKGKFTTDPENHTGEGIFFSSRMMEKFIIMSSATYFSHNKEDDLDWILESPPQLPLEGTSVIMKTKNDTARTVQKIFNQFADPDSEDYGFAKTVVPVKLVQYGNEMLVSRSQAKRLLARVDRFKVVILDFEGVAAIGQAFADEIFRVFAQKKSAIRILPINMNEFVQSVVVRAV
jgi:uncharacterized protein (DUF1330 family)